MTNQQAQSNESVPYWVMRRGADRGRLALRQAIHRALRDRASASVLEVGSGGGLLASWAAEVLTDGSVVAVDDDEALWKATTIGLREHHNRRIITILHIDNLLEWTPAERWDLLLCDVLSSGLITQPQVALVNHFLQYGSPGSEVLPVGAAHVVELLGLGLDRLPVPLPRTCFHDDAGVTVGCELSSPSEAGRVLFGAPVGGHLDVSASVAVSAPGLADAIRLSTTILTAQDARAHAPCAATPLVIPLPGALAVSQGQRVLIRGLLMHRTADDNGRATGCALPTHVEMTAKVVAWTDSDALPRG